MDLSHKTFLHVPLSTLLTQEVLYEGDQCLLAPSPPPLLIPVTRVTSTSPPPLLIPASSVTPVTPPFSLDSLCPPTTTQNPAQVPKGKLSPAEVLYCQYLKITLSPTFRCNSFFSTCQLLSLPLPFLPPPRRYR